MAALENENIQLKRLVKKTEPRGGLATARRSSHGQQSHVGPGGDQDASGSILLEGAEIGHTKEQSIQIESLKSALRFLRTENSALRTRAAMLDLGLTPDMSTLKNPLGRLNTESLQDGAEGAVQSETEKLTAKTDSELKAVALEARRLIKDARIVCASPKVVDLTKHSATKAIVSKTGETATTGRRGWQALKKTPEWEYHAQQAALNTIQQRSNELKERLAKVARSGPAGGSIKLNKLSMVETARIGRVHIPRGVALSGLVGAPEGAPVVRKDLAVYLRSSSEFEAMHQLFVR
ncbi:hypothetical protein BGW38_008778 [Lunasporangiospora selenospora]|uniref:Uncharacterized protein n=1 Tax=Lunasporangiospora selenospora TaxID=979761 RepID=A0A9P6FJ63_9FUNG|nr:hypothetical protein BGW38_008778 [Lunasporangiospora selenospora]